MFTNSYAGSGTAAVLDRVRPLSKPIPEEERSRMPMGKQRQPCFSHGQFHITLRSVFRLPPSLRRTINLWGGNSVRENGRRVNNPFFRARLASRSSGIRTPLSPLFRANMIEPKITIELDERVVDQLQAEGLEQRELEPVFPLALAVEFYRRRWVSLGLAADLADLDRVEFVRELADREVPLVGLSDQDARSEISRMKSMLG